MCIRDRADVVRILSPCPDCDAKPQRKRRRCGTSAKPADDIDHTTVRLHLAVDGIVCVKRDQLRAESETVMKAAQQSCVLAL